MAVDTRDKRGNVINIAQFYLPLYPNPDAAIGDADRQQTAHCYRGISAGAPTAITGGGKTVLGVGPGMVNTTPSVGGF